MNQLKVIQSQKEELEIYESFIKRYNLEELFDSYCMQYDDNKHGNKDNKGLYWYEYRLRGYSIGCQPKGHIEVNESIGRYGIIAYNRLLTDNEINNYDLQPYRVA